MKTIFQVLLMLACVCAPASADVTINKVVLNGSVTDAIDGQPVVGASIYFPQLKQGTVTNAEGHYTLKDLPAVKTTIQVSYVGHLTIIQTIDLRNTTTCDFILQENNAMLKEVVVTGLTGSTRADRSPAPISVVAPRVLQATPSTNIIDAVAHQPGVSQITTGGGISKPVIRGLGYNRIVTVNDGIRQEGQQWGDEHGIEVDAQSVHSVEILKGPATLMYGSDAMAGVLVLHETPVMPQGTMALNVGSEYQTNNHLFDYTVDFAGNQHGWVWNWRWSEKDAGEYKNKADGHVPGSQFHERALTGMLGINRGWGYSHLKLSYYNLKPGLVEGERDEDTGLLEPSEAFQKIYHYKAVLDNSFLLGNGSLKAVVGYQQNRRREFEEAGELGLDFRLHTVNYDVHYLQASDADWQYAAGISGMWQHSENLGEEYLIPSYRLFDAGVFASATRQFDRLTLSGGLRYDIRRLHSYGQEDDGELRFTDFTRNFNGLTGSVGAIYNITPRLNMRVNVSRGFRAPNLSELGSNGEHEGTFRYEIGNQQLSPEHSWQLDLGIDYSSEIISTQLSLFANHIDNYIFLERLATAAADNMYQYCQGTARLLGFEAMVDIHPVEPLHFENTFSYVNARQLNQPEESRWLPFTPAPRWNSDLRYDIIRDGRTLTNTFVSLGLECYLKQDHAHTAYDTETATPSYTLLNLTAGTDIRWHKRTVASVYLSATNLTDRAYQSHLSRLKYAEGPGICNMGRSFGVKLLIPVTFK
ncbi:MAG: TonB-dependent receptor [Prevotella sp.]|nr:TonB-dependent receptor [Prevotella sp.]